MTYKEAGVDVSASYKAISQIKKHVAKTKTDGVIGSIGSFAGLFQIPKGYEEPVLVSGTDGVGTKLDIAFRTQNHKTVGIDCVAMCVNDIACIGAKPLYFLDYIGIGELLPDQVEQIVEGISEGCIISRCALIGGETAEMPGFYKKGEYDIAGFAVGIVEKSKIIDGSKIKQGDVLIGIESAGLHSNGFSLVRNICFEHKKLNIKDYINELGCTLEEELLKPTKIYVDLIQNLINKVEIKAIAHVTGGGWYENIPRMFDNKFKAVVNKVDASSIKIFELLKKMGNVSEKEMYNTFNMGVGLVLAVDEKDLDKTLAEIYKQNEKAHVLGFIDLRKDDEENITID